MWRKISPADAQTWQWLREDLVRPRSAESHRWLSRELQWTSGVTSLVLCEFDETVEDLRRKNRRPGRKAFAALAHREAGLTYRMIAEYLEVSPPAISKMIEASADLERVDRGFRRSMERIRKELSLS